MIAYLRHDVRRAVRNRRLLVFSVLMPSLLFLVLSQLRQDAVDGADGVAYLMVSMAVYGAMSAAIGTGGLIAVERGLGWNRMLRLTPISPWSYVAAKVVLSVLLAVPPLVIVLALGATVGHVHLAASTWLLIAAAAWLGALPFAGLGLVVGYAADPESVPQVSGLIYLLMSVLGGLWIPIEVMPAVLRSIAEWTPVYWVGRLARAPIFPGQTLDGRVVAAVLGWALLLVAVGVWRFRRDTSRA